MLTVCMHCVCVCVSHMDLLSKHFRCYSIDMAINAWKGNHFGVTLDVSAFHCHFLSIESFYRKPSFSLCSAALVIITRMPPSPTAEAKKKTKQKTPPSLLVREQRRQFRPRSPPLLARGFELKTSFTGRLFVRSRAAAAGSGKLQLFSINRDTIDLNMW